MKTLSQILKQVPDNKILSVAIVPVYKDPEVPNSWQCLLCCKTYSHGFRVYVHTHLFGLDCNHFYDPKTKKYYKKDHVTEPMTLKEYHLLRAIISMCRFVLTYQKNVQIVSVFERYLPHSWLIGKDFSFINRKWIDDFELVLENSKTKPIVDDIMAKRICLLKETREMIHNPDATMPPPVNANTGSNNNHHQRSQGHHHKKQGKNQKNGKGNGRSKNHQNEPVHPAYNQQTRVEWKQKAGGSVLNPAFNDHYEMGEGDCFEAWYLTAFRLLAEEIEPYISAAHFSNLFDLFTSLLSSSLPPSLFPPMSFIKEQQPPSPPLQTSSSDSSTNLFSFDGDLGSPRSDHGSPPLSPDLSSSPDIIGTSPIENGSNHHHQTNGSSGHHSHHRQSHRQNKSHSNNHNSEPQHFHQTNVGGGHSKKRMKSGKVRSCFQNNSLLILVPVSEKFPVFNSQELLYKLKTIDEVACLKWFPLSFHSPPTSSSSSSSSLSSLSSPPSSSSLSSSLSSLSSSPSLSSSFSPSSSPLSCSPSSSPPISPSSSSSLASTPPGGVFATSPSIGGSNSSNHSPQLKISEEYHNLMTNSHLKMIATLLK